MVFNEIKKDLFTVDSSYHLAHCISADCALGAGIAKIFDKKYPTLKKRLKSRIINPDFLGCVLIDELGIFNLVTKRYYWDKPKLKDLKHALERMKYECVNYNISKIAMPLIGCGLDRLNWGDVKKEICLIFEYTDIEILVCKI